MKYNYLLFNSFSFGLVSNTQVFSEHMWDLSYSILINGFAHWVQNAVAFTILGQVSPVTYSIANTFKRVFVIIIAIVWFQNPVSIANGVGITIAMAGAFLYNQAKIRDKEHKHVSNS
jgi:solute carrier family 35 protein E1